MAGALEVSGVLEALPVPGEPPAACGGRLAAGEAPRARPAGGGLWRLAAGGRGRHLLPTTSGGRGGGPAPRPAPRARRYLTCPPGPEDGGTGRHRAGLLSPRKTG